MANAAIAYANLADLGLIAASSQVTLLPTTNLQTPHVQERWRSFSNVGEFFVCDLGALKTIDTIMVRGLTCGANATAQVRVSSIDTSGATGDLADSGTLTASSQYFDYRYGAVVYVLPAPVSARYIRVDLSDPDGTYVEAGRLFVGLRTQFSYNFDWSWSLGWVDRSRTAKTTGGQTLVWVDNAYRVLDVNFSWISSDERYGIVEAIDRTNGIRESLLFITDTASTNFPRDTIFGLASNVTPITTPGLADIFSKHYQIEERL